MERRNVIVKALILSLVIICLGMPCYAAAGNPISVDKYQLYNQLVDAAIEKMKGDLRDKVYEGVSKGESELLKVSNFNYLLEDFKDVGLDPNNPQISKTLADLIPKLIEKTGPDGEIKQEDVDNLLNSVWKPAVTLVMDKESAGIIESVYNLAAGAQKKIDEITEIYKKEGDIPSSEWEQTLLDYGFDGEYVKYIGDLDILIKEGTEYIRDPWEATKIIYGAFTQSNPEKKIAALFSLGNKFSDKIPILGDLIQPLFALGEGLLEASRKLADKITKNIDQSCIHIAGQHDWINNDKVKAFYKQFPNAEACPVYVERNDALSKITKGQWTPTGATKVPAIYTNTYVNVKEPNKLYFWINGKWIQGVTGGKHHGAKEIRNIITWLRSNGLAAKVDDQVVVYKMYNHAPAFDEFKRQGEEVVTEVRKRLFGKQGIISTLSACDDEELNKFIHDKIELDKIKEVFPIKKPPTWPEYNNDGPVWDDVVTHLIHCQYSRYLKESTYKLFSLQGNRPILVLEKIRDKAFFTPVKIIGTAKYGDGSPVTDAEIRFEKPSSMYSSDMGCQDKKTGMSGRFIFYYLKRNPHNESVEVSVTDANGEEGNADAEIDLSISNKEWVNIIIGEKDCKDGFVWNDDMQKCEIECPAYATAKRDEDGLAFDCDCDDGYDWNDKGTECVAEVDTTSGPDCSLQPNMESKWSFTEKKYVCDCLDGYDPAPDGNGCIDPNIPDTTATGGQDTTTLTGPDCSILPNMEQKVNPQTGTIFCECIDGFEPDPLGNGCIKIVGVDLSDVDCSAFLNTEAVHDPATGGARCDCKAGYVWNATNDACITIREDQLGRADCSNYPNSIPKWSDADQAVYCDCASGFEWNGDHTQCVPDKATQIRNSDCSAYANTVPKWSDAENGVICDCASGFEWNDAYTACVPDKNTQVRNADCSAYPNTGPRWDNAENQVVCDCIYGYEWNVDYTACEKEREEAPDCGGHYANTRAVWSKKDGKYYCECIKGYEWNKDQSGCVMTEYTASTQAGSACAQYGPAKGKWNAATQTFDCYCKSGYMWNANGSYCIQDPQAQTAWEDILNTGISILEQINGGNSGGYGTGTTTGGGYGTSGGGNAENPVPAPENQHEGVCNTVYRSGANAAESYSIPVYSGYGGTYQFYYDHITVKDRTHVYYNGQKIFDTGCVGGSQTVDLQISGFGGNVTVIVDPNCEGTSSTQWSIKLICPGD